jgi:hypothetical protein
LWSAFRNKYEIELWDTAGALLRDVVVKAPWFQDWYVPQARGARDLRSHPPQPFISDIQQDAAGYLWVVVLVADERWQKAISNGGPHGSQIDDLLYHDVIVQVLSLQTGRILASKRIDQPLSRFIGPGLLASVVEDRGLVPQLDVWSVTLNQLPRR